MARSFPTQKTTIKRISDKDRKWYVVDASGKVLGRLANQIAKYLMGKEDPAYFPGIDRGNFVVVINASKVVLTGDKLDKKLYYRYSGYPGGIRVKTARELMNSYPDRVVKYAVKRMLPKNNLGSKMFKRLKVYADDKHPHSAQKPEPLAL
ncbi:MAG: 50S ribosomal protein L13 [Thermotogaceae bacterium]|nr:50S ribosomal protein L13 [Thermotogaceae bacterium]